MPKSRLPTWSPTGRSASSPEGSEHLLRDALLDPPVVRPRIVAPQVPDAELFAQVGRAQLLPRERHRHVSAGTRARRVRRDRARRFGVAQVIDEDLAAAALLRHLV